MEVIESMNSDGGLYLIAETAGEIVSQLSFTPGRKKRNEHAGDFGITVLKKYWGLGIGTKMVQYLLLWAIESGQVRKINLRVRTDNHAAIAVYKKLGFQVEGTVTRNLRINDQFFDSYLMGLQIDPPSN